MTRYATVLAAVLVCSLSGLAQAWELPVHVTEQWGQGGPRYISGGVPLLPGQAKEVADLTLAVRQSDGTLAATPAQFRVLARWWRGDNSIRWVLVDTQTVLDNWQDKVFVLTDAKLPPASPKSPVAVEQTDETITVSTGAARFVVSKKAFNLLDKVFVDANRDGQFAADEQLLAGSAQTGVVMTDTLGNRYLGSRGVDSVEVIEAGPLRVRVRARGRNMPAVEGKGYSKGLYGYDVFMDFFAGSTDVAVDLVLTNNFKQSIGEPTFDDASMLLKLAGNADGYRLYGSAPLDGKLAAGESVCLYQDSNGGETWQRAQGDYSETQTTSFRGYKIFRRADGKETVIASGDQARGLTHLFNAAGGMIVHTRNFWQQFPKGVEVAGDGTFRLALWPKEAVVPQYLEDAGGKGHEIVLHFYSPKAKTAYAYDDRGRTWPHVLADCWDYRNYPRPELSHIAATGALTDLGPFTVPTAGFDDYPAEVHYRRMLMTDRYWGNGFGWNVFGSRWQAHGGHSTRGARQPMKEDHFLYSYYVSGGRGWLQAGNDRSRHFRDVRSYRIDEQDPFGFGAWDTFNKANRSEDYCHRPVPRDGDVAAYSQGRWKRSTWWLPNPAHMTLDLCYDRYLLFGDQRAFENLRIIAGHGGNFVAYTRPNVHRETGWCMRTLVRYWELTGDQAARKCIDDAIKNHSVLIGKEPLVSGSVDKPNWWFTQVYSRGFAQAAFFTRDPQALALCKSLAVGKEDKADYYCQLFAVLYHLTGEQKYKDAVMAKTRNGDKLLVVRTDGDWPANSHWLLNQPPRPISGANK